MTNVVNASDLNVNKPTQILGIPGNHQRYPLTNQIVKGREFLLPISLAELYTDYNNNNSQCKVAA